MLEDLTQRAESVIVLQAAGMARKKNFGRKSRVKRNQINVTRNERARVLNVERLRQLEEGLNQCGLILSSFLYDTTPMSMMELVAAVECGEFDIEDRNSMKAAPYCRVCMNGNERTSQCSQEENLKAFLRAQKKDWKL